MFSFHDLDLFLYRQSCRISSKFESFLRASNALGRISSGNSFIDVRLRKFAELIEYGNVMRVRVSHFLSRFFGLFPTQGVNCVIALEWRGWFCRGGGSRQGVVELGASLLAYGGKSEPFLPFLLFLFLCFFPPTLKRFHSLHTRGCSHSIVVHRLQPTVPDKIVSS